MFKTTYQISSDDLKSISIRIGRVMFFMAIANVLVWWLLHPIATTSFSLRSTIFWHKKAAPDIIFIGSSATRENLDADMAAAMLSKPDHPVTAFNLGITGGGPVVERAILRDIAFKRIDRGDFGMPALWVFEYHPLELAPLFEPVAAVGMKQVTDIGSWMDRYDSLNSPSKLVVDTLKNGMGVYQRALFDRVTYEFTRHLPILQLGNDWATKDRVRRIVRKRLAEVGIGQPPAAIPDLPALYLKEIVDGYSITDTSTAAVGDMIQMVKARGGKVVVFSFPFSDGSGMSREVLGRFDGVIKSIADSKGVPFYQLTTRDCDLVDDDFFDYIHVMRHARPKSTTCVVETALRNQFPREP